MKIGQLLFYCYINGGIDGYLRRYTYVRMNIFMYGKMHGYAVSYFESKSTALVVKEPCSVIHPLKKVLLRTTMQLPSYIKVNINSAYTIAAGLMSTVC